MATLELPETQKSLLFNTSTLSLSLDPHAPLPSPGVLETEHLIRVHATAITAGELTWGPFMKDYWGEYQVPCYDVSGTVLTRVPGSRFIPGDKIYGRIMATRPGAAREYGTVLPSEAAKVPAGLDMLEAASIPMSALTAWQALFEHGNLTASYAPPDVPHIDAAGNLVGGQAAGKRLLVLGAASSVGRMAVQFGKLAGAYIVGTASYANSEVVRALGADEVVDYHDTSMREWVRGEEGRKFDLVFDCVGGGSMRDGWNAVREDGAYISVVVGFAEPEGGKPVGVKSMFFVMESRGEELERMGGFVERGMLKGAVDSVWKVEEFEEAFKRTGGGHAKGKVVFKTVEEEV